MKKRKEQFRNICAWMRVSPRSKPRNFCHDERKISNHYQRDPTRGVRQHLRNAIDHLLYYLLRWALTSIILWPCSKKPRFWIGQLRTWACDFVWAMMPRKKHNVGSAWPQCVHFSTRRVVWKHFYALYYNPYNINEKTAGVWKKQCGVFFANNNALLARKNVWICLSRVAKKLKAWIYTQKKSMDRALDYCSLKHVTRRCETWSKLQEVSFASFAMLLIRAYSLGLDAISWSTQTPSPLLGAGPKQDSLLVENVQRLTVSTQLTSLK